MEMAEWLNGFRGKSMAGQIDGWMDQASRWIMDG